MFVSLSNSTQKKKKAILSIVKGMLGRNYCPSVSHCEDGLLSWNLCEDMSCFPSSGTATATETTITVSSLPAAAAAKTTTTTTTTWLATATPRIFCKGFVLFRSLLSLSLSHCAWLLPGRSLGPTVASPSSRRQSLLVWLPACLVGFIGNYNFLNYPAERS